MSPKWFFREFRPGDRARNSQVAKFFRSDAVEDQANAVVREGIQNSLDAAIVDAGVPGSVCVHICIAEAPPGVMEGYSPGLFSHLDAAREKLVDAPSSSEPVRFLVFEDFGTTGLSGDPNQWEPLENDHNAFFSFFRGEGVSEKAEHQRGRHGVGKMVFTDASRARCIFGLTVTKSSDAILMGTATLPQHRLGTTSFHPDGWFGNTRPVNGGELVVPLRDPASISQFSKAFGLTREGQTGLSIVVPWLDSAVTGDSALRAVLKGFFWPILQGRLVVHVSSMGSKTIEIDENTAYTVAQAICDDPVGYRTEVLATLDLATWARRVPSGHVFSVRTQASHKPAWDSALIPDDLKIRMGDVLRGGGSVAVKFPLGLRRSGSQDTQAAHFTVYLSPDASCKDGRVMFIREGLLISAVRCRRTPGYRALVVVEDGVLADFLGDSENPSHTEWQKDNVRGKYTYSEDILRFVVNSVPNLLKALNDERNRPDPTVMLDLFSIPSRKETPFKGRTPKGKSEKGGGKNEHPVVPTGPKLKRYSLQRHGSGFLIRRGDEGASRPSVIDLQVAYGVRRGNPFKKYSPADFRLESKPISVTASGARILRQEGNELSIAIDDDEFSVDVTGFDTNRDLHVDPKVDRDITEDGDDQAV